MLALDLIIRFSTFGLLGSLALITWRDRRRSLVGGLLIALCISLMAMMISSSPKGADIPLDVRQALRFIDLPNTVLAWLFVRAIMEDDFRLNRVNVGLALIYCVSVWFLTLNIPGRWVSNETPLVIAVNLYALILFVTLIVNVVRQRKDDLLEPRRRLRWIFVASVAGLVALAILSELLLSQTSFNGEITRFFKVGITFILVLAGHYWFLVVPDTHIAFETPPSSDRIKKNVRENLTHKERRKLALLEKAMAEDGLWRDPKLSLDVLAKHLAVSPKYLRSLIHENLGYRNFRSFLQSYRIEATKLSLADTAKRDVTILEIALEAGFNSTSTFNRVFKQAEGQSPKEFRRLSREIGG